MIMKCATKKLKVIINYTGRIRIARDLIDDLYVHMGFQKPSSYKTVIDFQLEIGKVIKMLDRSTEVALIRGEFRNNYGKGNLIEGIQDAFDLGMELE